MPDRQLIDDEIYSLFGHFQPEVRIVMLSDSCHSGTVARMRVEAGLASGEEELPALAGPAGSRSGRQAMRHRLAPLAVTKANFEARRDFYVALQAAAGDAEQRPLDAGVILISGCQDMEFSFETPDGKNGQFTASVKAVWNNGKFKGGYRRFHHMVASRIPPFQNPNLFMVGEVPPAFINATPFAA